MIQAFQSLLHMCNTWIEFPALSVSLAHSGCCRQLGSKLMDGKFCLPFKTKGKTTNKPKPKEITTVGKGFEKCENPSILLVGIQLVIAFVLKKIFFKNRATTPPAIGLQGMYPKERRSPCLKALLCFLQHCSHNQHVETI